MNEVKTLGWRVGRQGLDREWEYLDHDRDLFYKEGVYGYKTQQEANHRAHQYKGDDRVYVVSNKGTKYPPSRKPPVNANYQFNTLIELEAHVRTSRDPQVRSELYAEFQNQLTAFITMHGVWALSSVLHTKKLFELITHYEILSSTELVFLLRYGKR